MNECESCHGKGMIQVSTSAYAPCAQCDATGRDQEIKVPTSNMLDTVDKTSNMLDKSEDEQVKADRAFMNYTSTVERKKQIAGNFLELGRLFKECRDQKFYQVLGYDTFESYCAQPELGFKRSSVYGFIETFEIYVEKLKYSPEFLQEIPYGNIQTVNPVVKGFLSEAGVLTDDQALVDKADEWLFKAKDLSRSDLIDEVRAHRGQPPKSYQPEKKDEPEPFDFDNYLSFVRAHSCVTCGAKEVEAAHFPRTKKRGAPPECVIPLCHECHIGEFHQDPINFLIKYRVKIFEYFYGLVLACYKALHGGMNDTKE